MIEFTKYQLDNGLTVIINEDPTSSMVCVNLLYKVGSAHENESLTGFAHLFEHLMFRGTKKAPKIDIDIETAGGYLNAFTTKDLTNYYEVIPAENVELALFLEADRMRNLIINEESLKAEKSIVSEEFKQRYLNPPYGDAFSLLMDLAYKKHPYKWMTIGKDISHVENAKLSDVQDFYNNFYRPNNAILVISGNIKVNKAKKLVQKYFESLKASNVIFPKPIVEPTQLKKRALNVTKNVPADSLYMAFHMAGRNSNEYYPTDFITDILSRGESTRLYQNLVKEQKLFSTISSSIFGTTDPGILYISGKLSPNITFEQAENALWNELIDLKNNLILKRELQKIKNLGEIANALELESVENKAFQLAYYEYIGDINLINTFIDKYNNVSSQDILDVANKIFKEENLSVLYYESNNKTKN